MEKKKNDKHKDSLGTRSIHVVTATEVNNKTRIRFYVCNESFINQKAFVKEYISDFRRHEIFMNEKDERAMIESLSEYLKSFYNCIYIKSFLDKRDEYIARYEERLNEKRKKIKKSDKIETKAIFDEERARRAREYNTKKVQKYRYIKQATGLKMSDFNKLPEEFRFSVLSYGGFTDEHDRFVINEKRINREFVKTQQQISDDIKKDMSKEEEDANIFVIKRMAVANFLRFKGMPEIE